MEASAASKDKQSSGNGTEEGGQDVALTKDKDW